MESGSAELSRIATAYAASVSFGLTFLLASATGSGVSTALWRGAVVIAVVVPLSRLLVKPVIDVVLDAMAREQAKKRAAAEKEQAA